ncbi:type IX secretion system outer membrane channel protein PorV [Chitinophagaceae bacterium LB-8]|uniref:Type IX secretion system outer membrane channel protein PorV n=1 Tax=Paraflavisolibacter caeni TaxID=2982496 RepID=A0A9X2XTP1_9BACT|nr:type IX secretion system outer membrane channel protein PorV [Paraflavisolibacter caeni]MCU7548425.1 type IX secretion system outer membrane channel protein PorV [Paraflavisolibacter caeni]
MKAFALKITTAFILLITAVPSLYAQDKINIVTTAVPFLRISPDARSGGMGDLGVATDPDASSSFFNVGKVPFNPTNSGINVSYTPWLKSIVNDVYLAAASGFYKLDELQALSASFRYFNLGNIQFTGTSGEPVGEGRPREFGVDVGYSRKLSDYIGIGIGVKYINSDLVSGVASSGSTYKAGNAVAADLGFYFNAQDEAGQGWSMGTAFTNLGTKIGYTNNADQKDYIPANFSIGTNYTKVMDESNKISFGLEMNKLMVPTPPLDPAQYDEYRNKSVVSSWFTSFADAPGGFSEELQELQFSIGGEYWYNNQFALRAGYFYEDKDKGNRRYLTAGVGLRYNVFNLNFSYLAPTGSGVNQNPLANTLRFSLAFDLDGGSEE